MNFPPGYRQDLTTSRRRYHFPNLHEDIFSITSLKTDEYNCAAFVLNIDDEWIQFKDAFGNLDIRLKTYINFYEGHSFVEDENLSVEINKFKIAIYYVKETLEFTHVAFQTNKGTWKSKLGDWEDIEHNSLECLFGHSYGNAFKCMSKRL